MESFPWGTLYFVRVEWDSWRIRRSHWTQPIAHFGRYVAYAILLHKNVERIDPHFRFGLITADADDNKFVDCAIIAGAKYIVTEDRHFNVLKEIQFPKVEIVGIDRFAEML